MDTDTHTQGRREIRGLEQGKGEKLEQDYIHVTHYGKKYVHFGSKTQLCIISFKCAMHDEYNNENHTFVAASVHALHAKKNIFPKAGHT